MIQNWTSFTNRIQTQTQPLKNLKPNCAGLEKSRPTAWQVTIE